MVKSSATYIVLILMGLIVAAVGTSAHRAIPFLGVALALLMVVSASVFARTWKGWAGIGTFAAAWFTAVAVFAQEGPGLSILIAYDYFGFVWVLGGAAAIGAVSVFPGRVLMGTDDVTP